MQAVAYWSAASSLFSVALAALEAIALLVVALAVVRKRHSDAALFVALAGGGLLLVALVQPLSFYLTSWFAGAAYRLGPTLAVLQTTFSLLRAGCWALLIYGLVRLAREQPPAGPPWPNA